jgi:hypothetical protein
MPSDAERYIRSGSKTVNGWLAPESGRLVQIVSDAQLAWGTTGSVGEIGIHHGRLFILLYLLAHPTERAFAVDIFGAQELNIDGSGSGDRLIFESHLRRYGADMDRIAIVEESSMAITPERLRALAGPARLFSIDGGHTTPVALNDLALAEATLVDGGVVILDDVFQSLFPGVSAALGSYLLGGGALVPFAVSPEKVVLTQPEHHGRLLRSVRAGMQDVFIRHEDFFGHQVAILRGVAPITERLQRALATSEVYRKIRRTPLLGRLIETSRPVALRVLRR